MVNVYVCKVHIYKFFNVQAIVRVQVFIKFKYVVMLYAIFGLVLIIFYFYILLFTISTHRVNKQVIANKKKVHC